MADGPQPPPGRRPTAPALPAPAPAGPARAPGGTERPYDEDEDGYEEFFDFERRGRGTYVRVPRRARGLRRLVGTGTIVLVAMVALVAGAGLWAYRQVDPAGGPGEQVSVEVPFGSTTADIADILDDSGIVSSSRLFQEYVRFKGKGPFKAGSYVLARNSSLAEALAVLDAGPAPVPFKNVTVPEGLRLSELVASLAEQVPRLSPQKLNDALDGGQVRSRFEPPGVVRPEGFVFPDTYRLADDQTEAQVLATMAAQFDAVANEVGLEAGAAKLGFTPYQIVTIASMIEEEVKVAEERPMVARVIYNRLAQDMRLDIDATTLYAVGKTGNSLTESDLASDSPYNTRKVTGLPPGPIAAPGKASLRAALEPAEGPWLYYVLQDADGHHFFTDSAAAFDRQVEISRQKGLLG